MTKPGNLPANWAPGGLFTAAAENSVESAVNWLLATTVAPAPTGSDQTSALNSVLTAGSYVQLQAGTYVISGELTIPSTCTLAGAGQGVTIISMTSGNPLAAIYSTGTDVAVRDLTVNVNGSTNTSSLGILFSGTTRGTVRNVRVLNAGTVGIQLTGGTDGLVEYCVSDGSSLGSTGSSVAINVANTLVTGCIMRNFTGGAIAIAGGQVSDCFMYTNSSNTASLVFLNANYTKCVNNWIDITQTALVVAPTIISSGNYNYGVVRGNLIIGPANTACTTGMSGIMIYGSHPVTCSGWIVSDNVIYGCWGDAILFGVGWESTDTGYGNIVANNLISSEMGNGSDGQGGLGIEINVNAATVIGNTIFGNSDAGIGIYGQQCIVANNWIYGCGTSYGGSETVMCGIAIWNDYCTAIGNTCINNGYSGNTQNYGIFAGPGFSGAPITQCTISNNTCTDTRSGSSRTQLYGIWVQDTGNANTNYCRVTDNVCTNNVDGQISLTNSTAAACYVRGNYGVADQDIPLAATTISATGTTALTTQYSAYVATGTTATWTMPAVSGNANGQLWLKNRGSGTVTVNSAGSDHMYTTSAVTTFSLTAGTAARFINDGTYWVQM